MSQPRRFASLTAFVLFSAAACASPAQDSASTSSPVTDVPQTSVKDQSIGNCWTYATVGWVESLAKSADGKDRTLSESYVTYWYWFDQIAGGRVYGNAVQEGGTWGKAIDLILRYGVPEAGNFIAAESTEIRSSHQEAAALAINASLKSGALETASARRDRALVRRELDKAWQLDPKVVAWLDAAFGADATQTLGAGVPSGVPLHRAADLPAKLKDSTGAYVTATAADAMGTSDSGWNLESRSGDLAWQTASYPDDAQGRRDFLKRVQRALDDHQPVILSWYVDFNALDAQGRFLAPPAAPGSQGGHMVIMEDYEVDNVPGFGTLPAGVEETRPEALDAALSDQAVVKFIRVKNSWGDYKSPVISGYHDLYLTYLNGPLKECETDADEKPILDKCHDGVPLEDVVLPAGY